LVPLAREALSLFLCSIPPARVAWLFLSSHSFLKARLPNVLQTLTRVTPELRTQRWKVDKLSQLRPKNIKLPYPKTKPRNIDDQACQAMPSVKLQDKVAAKATTTKRLHSTAADCRSSGSQKNRSAIITQTVKPSERVKTKRPPIQRPTVLRLSMWKARSHRQGDLVELHRQPGHTSYLLCIMT
jgi:hypothetical protein